MPGHSLDEIYASLRRQLPRLRTERANVILKKASGIMRRWEKSPKFKGKN